MALYFRMIVMLLVELYTSRVILNALGVIDYGIYNVVGGFVAMFSLVSSSVVSSVGRSLTFELGTGNVDKLKRTFSTSIYVLIGLSLILLVLFEVGGVWYLNNKMVLPAERFHAASWCFQLSVLTFLLGLLNAPYSASVISHERMDVYAYMSIIDAVLKLLICYAIICSTGDRLITYAILLCVVGILNQIVYVVFCRKRFVECRISWVFDKKLFKEMFSFAGWNFIGCSAATLRIQGATLLLNWAGGPAVNAANGIANRVCNSVNGFVANFTQAFNPQITKQYAAGEYESLMKLLIYGSKYSYYLLLLLGLPVMFNAHFILELWLGIVPEHTVPFVRWTIVFMLAEAVSRPIITAKNATGRIRNYQLVVGGVLLLMLPLSYAGLKFGLPVEFVPFCNALTATAAVFTRMYMLRGDFPCWSSAVFFKKVLFNVACVSVVAAILPCICYFSIADGWVNFFVTTSACVVSTSAAILSIGCSKSERIFIFSKFREGVSFVKRRVTRKQ